MNTVEIIGALSKDVDLRAGNDGAWLQFPIAVEDTAWNSDRKQREIVSYFFHVNWWLPMPFTDDDVPLVGDTVLIVGKLTQDRRGDRDKPSTRILAHTVTVTRRGKVARREVAERTDPWAGNLHPSH